jgi:alanyl-tRNA synthetase
MRRYYDDSYTTTFTARVIELTQVNDHPVVILDQTYFYPTSGGQPNDTGAIDGVPVTDVISRESDGAVLHILGGELVDDTVNCVVDWQRRFDHMQQHTGQHILSQAFIEIADAKTVGFHMSADSITIDLDKLNLAAEVISRVEDKANALVFADRPVTARLMSMDEAGVRMRKLPERIHTDGLRVIDIADGWDVTACGGTHVSRTGEIGVIKVLRAEKRGDKTRVEFRCGGRALSVFRAQNALVNQLTALLTCSAEEVVPAITRLQDEIKGAQRDLKAAKSALLDAEAASLIAVTSLENGLRVVKMTLAERDVNDIRLLAAKLAQTPGVIALFGVPGDKAHLVFARGEGVAHDMNALLKTALAAINGRGGGNASMAQGGGVPASTEQIERVLTAVADSVR